jgi:hypothetical protein
MKRFENRFYYRRKTVFVDLDVVTALAGAT